MARWQMIRENGLVLSIFFYFFDAKFSHLLTAPLTKLFTVSPLQLNVSKQLWLAELLRSSILRFQRCQNINN
jgi:hypothetical protein